VFLCRFIDEQTDVVAHVIINEMINKQMK